ncbi:MAG: hypothetical protein CMM01_20355 [Rhodopirellula sp.]|nr:hypothetical protein [Rhodopirellula sp.]
MARRRIRFILGPLQVFFKSSAAVSTLLLFVVGVTRLVRAVENLLKANENRACGSLVSMVNPTTKRH